MKKRYKLASQVVACAITATALFSCGQQQSTTPISGSSNSADGIAYVYIDSLLNGYDLYNEEMTQFYAKQQQYEQELAGKQNSLERRAMELQQNYEKRLITPTRAQEVQQQLAAEQQKLQQTYQQQAMELQDDQAMILNRVSDSIKNYINVYNADKRFKVILGTQGNSVVMYGDPSLDITPALVKGLNERYRGKGSAPAPKQQDTTSAK